MAKNSYLDKIVREQLDNYEVAYNPQDWTLLNAMIDEAIVPDTDAVDQAAQDVLHQFEVAYNPSDWELMNAKLDAQVPSLDDVAKNNLENLEVPYLPSDWELMENLLDTIDTPSIDQVAKDALQDYEPTNTSANWALMTTFLASIDTPPIDELAKDALTNHEVPYNLSDWAIMSDKLDASGFVDELDARAKQTLGQQEIPFEPKDWALMNEALDKDNKMRKRLLFAKSIELFLMIFAIWTIFLFIPDKDYSKDRMPSRAPIEKSQVPLQPKESIEEEWDESQPMANNKVHNNAIQHESKDIKLHTTVNTNTTNNKTETNRSSDFSIASKDKKHTATTIKKVTKDIHKNAIATTQQPTKVKHHTLIGGNRYGNQTNQGSIGELEIEQKMPNFNRSNEYNTFTEKELLEAITLVQAKKNATNLDFLDGKFAYLPEKRDLEMPMDYPKTKLPINRIALLTGADFHQIKTPDDAPIKQAQKGYSFGLRADFEINEQWEWAMGIMMAEFFYTHRTTEPLSQATNSFTLIGTNNIKVSTLQLPLHIQYNMYDEYPWRAYGTGGITGHFVIQLYQNKGEMTLINLANRVSNNPRTKDSDLGIFEEGGTIANNVFATADLGLGVERRINEHWGVFLQPTYRIGLSPTGNDQDHINTISFLLGTRLTL